MNINSGIISFGGVMSVLLLQKSYDQSGDAGAACGAMGVFFVIWLLLFLVIMAVSIGIVIFIFRYIKRDSITRGLPPDNSMKWLGLLGLLGLLIYVLKRPQGNVMPCPRCGKNRMQGLPRCPHCGQA